ncbi:hypothetical protein CSA80_01080 [Candidatus Saccharibacteria bacterium]|nr:MAG: hypothetical protein CR973_02075 [Candidatus Saccharibacteria bacterium]PID99343.1 MAG: hypothetical protein CSA80_01080 [Candidatus Saccharibacteria bacterium]
MKRVVVVSSQHGNEPLGEMLEAYMYQSPADVTEPYFVTANPVAVRQNVRYVESDMNRSYDRTDTYEGRLAQHLRGLLWRFTAKPCSRHAYYELRSAS